MKYDVLRDIDAFEKEYGTRLKSLLDSIANEKYELIIDRNGISYVNKLKKIVHIDPTDRLVYLTVQSLYLHIFTHPSWQFFNPNNIGETMFFFAKANLLHEILHILHSDTNAVDTFLSRYKSELDKKILFSIYNCIEDGFIEKTYGNDLIENGTMLLSEVRTLELYSLYFPNLIIYQRDTNIKLNSTMPFKSSELCQDVEIAEVLRQLYNILDRILFYATDLLDIVETAEFFELTNFNCLDKIRDLVGEYFIAKDIDERLNICDEILKIIKENIPNLYLLYKLPITDLVKLSLCSNDTFHDLDLDAKGIDFNEINVEVNNSNNYKNDASELYVKQIHFSNDSENVIKFVDYKNYSKKADDNSIKIKLNYQRAWFKTYLLSNDKKCLFLNNFEISEKRQDYSSLAETMYKSSVSKNISYIKYIENYLKQIILVNKGSLQNKQYSGFALDNHNLADSKKRVFSKKSVLKNADFSVTVLIDFSGSINNSMYSTICDKLIIFGNAFENVCIPYEIVGFNIINGQSKLNKIIFKGFSEKSKALSSLFMHKHGEYNSFDLVALASIKDMLRRKNFGKYIVLFVTDGKGIYVDKNGVAITVDSTKKEIETVKKQLLKKSCAIIPICFENKVLKEMKKNFPDTICCESLKVSGKKLIERMKKESGRF